MDENKVTSGAEEFGPDYLTLTDEEGKDHTFELVDTIVYTEQTGALLGSYVALLAAPEDPAEYLNSDGNLVIMKCVEEDGEDSYLTLIEDDEEFEQISDVFLDRLSDLYEFDEGEEE